MPLLLNLNDLRKGDVKLKGMLPIEDLEMESRDPMIRLPEELEYDLEAELVGNGILIQGRLEAALPCTCVRCLREFVSRVDLPDWSCHLHLEGADAVEVRGDYVDLTAYVREDILLKFPQHPLCESRCAGLETTVRNNVPRSVEDSRTNGVSSPWDELDRLEI